MKSIVTIASAIVVSATAGSAQMANQMTQEQLAGLTANGMVLQLGGPGQGYSGTLTMTPDGQGQGQAQTDAGETIALSGTWVVRDGQLCRTWASSDGNEVCEVWVLTSGNSVDAYVDGQLIGVNSW